MLMMMKNHLTADEEARFGPTLDPVMRIRGIEGLKYALDRFVATREDAKWFEQVLIGLAPMYVGHDEWDASREKIELGLAQQIELASGYQREDFEEDPISWVARYNKPAPDCHPWGDAMITLLEKWCKATPYEVWQVKSAVDEAARETLARVLIQLASDDYENDDCSDIRDAARSAFNDSMKAITKRLSPSNG